MMNNAPDIITIKGAPGTGKSQTAKCLASYFPRGVRMEIDTLRSMIISVAWTDQEEHIRMLSISAGLVYAFCESGYKPVIVVDTFSGNKLDRYLEELRSLDQALTVRSFALVTEEEELRRRLDSRPMDEFKDLEISLKLNDQVVRHRHPSEELLDTTNSAAADTAEMVYRLLMG